MKQSKILRVFSCVFAVVVLFGAMVLPVQAARSKQEVQQEINAKKEQLGKLEQQISAGKDDKEAAQKALKEYETQYLAMLDLLDEQEVMIENTQSNLESKTQELADTIQNIQQSQALFEERLVAIYYMNNSNAMLEAMLNVESLQQFLQIADTLQRVTKNDTDILAKLDGEKKDFETQREHLENTIDNLNNEMTQLQENRDWCTAKMKEMKTSIASIDTRIAQSQQAVESTQEEILALQKEYNAIMAAAVSAGSQKGDGTVRQDGPLVWPCPGGRFSSGYGDPRSNTGWHYGVDFTAPEGTPILAAASGTVQTATVHYSYGNYIILDNNDGLRTLYAHASALAVGAGQTVEAGQVIAYVGTTGDSTGNHLHFEVFDNGARVNPMASGYLNP